MGVEVLFAILVNAFPDEGHMLDEVTSYFLHSLLYLLPSPAFPQLPHKTHVQIGNTWLQLLVDGLDFLRIGVVEDLFVDGKAIFLLNGLIGAEFQ